MKKTESSGDEVGRRGGGETRPTQGWEACGVPWFGFT